MKKCPLLLVALAMLAPVFVVPVLIAAPIITEVAAARGTLEDEDRETPDWIEIYNPASAPVDLDGYYLTDSPALLTKWRFPAVTLAPNSYLVVFASGKDRAAAGSELHTNFQIDADGDEILLVEPDGTTVANELAIPGGQREGISYGPTMAVAETTLLPENSGLRALVPGDAGALPAGWADVGFDASAWLSGNGPAGYDTSGGSANPAAAAAYWPLDEGDGEIAHDLAGGFDGVLTDFQSDPLPGDWTDPAPTPFANVAALDFDGVDEYVATTYPGIGGTEARTVSFWVRTTDATDGGLVTWGDEATPNGRKWHIRINSSAANGTVGAIRTEIQGGNNIGSTLITDGEWHHVVCVWENDGTPDIADAKHYVDGSLETPTFVTPQAVDTDISGANTLPVRIGGRRQTNNLNTDAEIDDVRIYNRALTEAEIADLNSAAPPAAGLQAHWNFDDASGSLAADASGNGWFGVLTNMEIRDSDWVPAPPTAFANNTALAFDGVNEYVETTYPGIGGTGARTVAFWVKTTDMADNGLLGWGDEAPNGRKWHLRINSDAANGTVGAIRTEVQGGNNIGTTVIADGQWHHVACVWEDDGTPDIADAIHYIDGVAETPSFTTDEPIDTDIAGANALPVWIGGRRQGAAFRYIDGQMDDVRIYSRALSAAEVAGLMSAAPAADGLEAHWAFDAGVGSQAADASGNGFTGVLRNMETGEDSGWSIDVPPVLDPPAASLSFNGEGGHVLTGYVGIVESNPRSVSVWVKTTDTADHGILAWGDSNTNGAKWHLRVNTSAAEGAVGAFRIEGQGGQIVGTTYIADGQWHHLACVFAPDDTPTLHDTRLYVDGVLEPATTGGDVAVNTVVLDPVTIGKRIQGAVHRPFAGLVSQAAIFSAPLDADQVAALFTGAAKPDDVVSFAGTLGLDLDAAMRGQNSSAFLRYDFSTPTDFGFDHLELRLRYDAGLIAYLNGAEVYRDNAPAAPAWDAAATGGRTDAAALVPHSTNISGAGGSLVPGGENTLALHSLNESAGDADFLAGAELVAITVTPGAAGYFAQPTPGGPNGTAAFEGLVGDTTFSVDRGFFTAPFDLEIATPATEGAAIYYTTDGSVPTPANGTLYAGPVAIGTTTVLRAAAFRDGFIQSNVDTQTYLFLDQVAAQSAAPPPGFPAAWDHQGGTREADYEMDPDLVGPVYTTQQVVASLQTHPTISLACDPADLWDPQNGFYANPGLRGGLWERACSIEFIGFEGGAQTQADAGLRMVGRASRSLDRFKHNLRVVFRGEYGDRRLNFPLMKGTGSEVERFNSLILRGGNGDSWINPGVIHRAQYIRDQWHRDMQRATGQPNQPQIYAHLYINGLYWGFYHVFDRMEDDFVAEHFGGQEEDYDVVKDAGTNSIMEVVDGDLDAWNALLAASAQDLSQPANYEAIQEYLNLDWFIDYLLVNFYSGNNDWDQSNWRAARRREPGAPWMLFSWDSERTDLNATGVANGALTGPNDRDVTTKNNLNFPTSIHQRLTAGSAEYRLRFADRTRKHFFNGGVLTPAGAAALYNARATEIYDALIAEACRWGDRHSEPPMTREFRWQEMLDMMNEDFFPFRTDIVLAQLRARGLYPAIDAPDFAQHGGNVAAGFPLTMGAAGGGTIYYTLDGSDPREEGTGAILGSEYTGPLALQATGTVKARAFNGVEWSALTEALFVVGTIASADNLVISEIMYRPAGDGLAEFLEIQNISGGEIDLTGARFTAGIDFAFPEGYTLAAGGRALIVRDAAAFDAAYGAGLPVAGVFANGTALNNDGERIALTGGDDAVIRDFTFNDVAPWPPAADGLGASLVLIDPASNPDHANPLNWRASVDSGNPDGSDAVAFAGSTEAELLAYALAGEPEIAPNPGGGARFSYTLNLGADDAIAEVQVAPDLDAWTTLATLPAERLAVGGGERFVWEIPADGSANFARLRLRIR